MTELISVTYCKSSSTRDVNRGMPQRCKMNPDVVLIECELVYLCYSSSFMSAIEVLYMNFSVSEYVNNHGLNCLSKIPQPYCQTGAVKWQYGNWK